MGDSAQQNQAIAAAAHIRKHGEDLLAAARHRQDTELAAREVAAPALQQATQGAQQDTCGPEAAAGCQQEGSRSSGQASPPADPDVSEFSLALNKGGKERGSGGSEDLRGGDGVHRAHLDHLDKPWIC